MINYTRELNAEQLRVVMEDGGPILVIAGAGSGKTRTLTYRVARLIERNVPPERILLATFTNKAARSMLSRVMNQIQTNVEGMWGGTFHHIAHRILRIHCHLLEYGSNFSIIDNDDSIQLINVCLAEGGINTKEHTFPRGEVLRDIISLSMNTEKALETIIENRYPYFRKFIPEILKVEEVYRKRKKILNVMDFDDLLVNCKKLLSEFPEVLKKYSERFLHVLVDEYQDTTALQANIIDLLASHHRNIMVVGDDAQSIYAFRGADIANMMHFPTKYPECKIFKLETNYRSTPEILYFANMSIVNNERQYSKTLKSVRGRGIRPVVVPVRNALQQAHFVCQRILELIYEGIPFGDIAVLYRAHFHSMEVQMEMTRRGIPYELRSGLRFFEQAHVKDVLSYLRVLANPFDEIAWKRIFNLCQKVGKVSAERLWNHISKNKEPLKAVLDEEFCQKTGTRATIPALEKLQSIIRQCLSNYHEGNIPHIITTVLECGYGEHLSAKYADAASRREDLEHLARYAGKFHSLDDFIGELALFTNLTEENETIRESTEEKIVLSSIHQAKGLEWSVVFMIWCSEGMMPLARTLREPTGVEEERRLFYVAVTRAKDQLYLCNPIFEYSKYSEFKTLSPSRFIMEITPLSEDDECPYEKWILDERTWY